jgi:hypothetical protein
MKDAISLGGVNRILILPGISVKKESIHLRREDYLYLQCRLMELKVE